MKGGVPAELQEISQRTYLKRVTLPEGMAVQLKTRYPELAVYGNDCMVLSELGLNLFRLRSFTNAQILNLAARTDRLGDTHSLLCCCSVLHNMLCQSIYVRLLTIVMFGRYQSSASGQYGKQ